jgi:hypothetical protein
VMLHLERHSVDDKCSFSELFSFFVRFLKSVLELCLCVLYAFVNVLWFV